VKDEGSNMNTMIIVLKSIINCETLGISKSFQVTCFEHAFLKVFNMQLLQKECLKTWNKFPTNLSNHICKNVWHGLNVVKWKTKMDESLHYYVP